TADALLLESVLEHRCANPDTPLFFVTENKNDFSDSADPKRPHPDFAREFEDHKIRYYLSIADAVEEIGNIQIPAEVKEIIKQHINYMLFHEDKAPDCCMQCQGALLNLGYRLLFGFAGVLYSCQKCGTRLHWIDPNY